MGAEAPRVSMGGARNVRHRLRPQHATEARLYKIAGVSGRPLWWFRGSGSTTRPRQVVASADARPTPTHVAGAARTSAHWICVVDSSAAFCRGICRMPALCTPTAASCASVGMGDPRWLST